MQSGLIRGGQKQTDNVSGRVVGGVEIHPFRRATEDRVDFVQSIDAGMRNRHSVANSRADLVLARLHGEHDFVPDLGGHTLQRDQVIDELGDDFVSLGATQIRQDALGTDDVFDLTHEKKKVGAAGMVRSKSGAAWGASVVPPLPNCKGVFLTRALVNGTVTAMRSVVSLLVGSSLAILLASCGTTQPSGLSGIHDGAQGNMGAGGPTIAQRQAQIANEPRGSFYYGRRYYVPKTRFWGYLRKPGQDWNDGRLVIFNERRRRQPDRFPEDGPAGRRYGFDNNYEYRIEGRFTGRELYEPNSNQFLPEFELRSYDVVDRSPGWLFSPSDSYNARAITLRPRR